MTRADRLTLIRPDDWHLHLRDGAAMASVLPDTARRFARAIVMPNLKPPVRTVSEAAAYRQRILDALPSDLRFEPLMTLYLTDNTTAEEVRLARASGFVRAVKYYPAGATTNSDLGVSAVEKAWPAIAAMETLGLPLLVHGETTEAGVDVFDREAVFIERVLAPLLLRFPRLKLVLEHVTTAEGVDFVRHAGDNVAGTITAHHLLYNRNALFQGGLRPHYYCLPVLKRERHRQALVEAATSDSGKFFLGTDSAPHTRPAKECGCGCAGIYSAHAAIELYAEAFEASDALDRLEGFASRHGPAFYGLPVNREHITLVRESWNVPESLRLGADTLVPLRAGEPIGWRLADTSSDTETLREIA